MLAASTLCRCRPACRRGTWGGGSGTDITTDRKNWGEGDEGELTWRPQWCSTGRTQRRQRACSASPPDYRRSQTKSRSCRPPATLCCLSEMIDSIIMILGVGKSKTEPPVGCKTQPRLRWVAKPLLGDTHWQIKYMNNHRRQFGIILLFMWREPTPANIRSIILSKLTEAI